MSNKPLVSVIMATYNRSNILHKAIESVLSQTFMDWELIVWDDGSTDSTKKVVNSYNDHRIKYCYGENHGQSYASNNAIKVSLGEFITFLDDDDKWIDEKLSIQVRAMKTWGKIDFLFSDFLDVNLTKNLNQSNFSQNSTGLKLLRVEKIDDDLFLIKEGMPKTLSISNFILPSTAIIRKVVFEKVGGFREELRNSKDFELWWRMGLAGICFAYNNKIYVTRYKYPGSLSSPSILTYKNKIKSLDFCLQETLSKDRKDLIPFLNRSYRNAWLNMSRLYGHNGEKKRMLKTFLQSGKYGFSLGSFRILFEAILSQSFYK